MHKFQIHSISKHACKCIYNSSILQEYITEHVLRNLSIYARDSVTEDELCMNISSAVNNMAAQCISMNTEQQKVLSLMIGAAFC